MRYFIIISLAIVFSPFCSYAQSVGGALPSMRDCSIASLSGSSQSLFSGTSFMRKYLLICNTGTAGNNIGVNLAGGTAALAGTGTITLVPGSCKEFSTTSVGLPDPPPGSITVIGTSGQPVACIEGR